MNKGLVVVAVAVALGGGAYYANNMMIDTAASELVKQVESVVEGTSDSVVDIQIVNTEVNKGDVKQELAVYITDGNNRIPTPLYVTHTAKVGTFGMNVDGKLVLPKDKGLAEEFIREVTSFNESFTYSFAPATQSFDVQSSLALGVISEHRSSAKIGKMTMNITGTADDHTGQIVLDGATLVDGDSSFKLGKVTFDSVSSLELHKADLLLADATIVDEMGSYSVKDVKLNAQADVGEKTKVSYDWAVGTLDINNPMVDLPQSKMGLKGKIGDFDTQKLIALSDAAANNQVPIVEDVLFRIVGDGISFSDVDLYLNDSSIKGSLEVGAEDYTGLNDHQMGQKLGSAIKSELDVTLSPELVSRIGLPPQALNGYFELTKDNRYTTKLLIDGNSVTANGLPLR
ncbi:hypothetical protein BCV00_13025 [Vibrio breoganii]|uniref:hypothetical protein n=1 Tax=Vibrio breoganii TaxID=553239 RepID=UPI000C857C1C|nr:hypothetical protein [Vibrio breoganii]PMG05355.1 hypothetical protein BCV00_13025 [Vibrio breoganii]